MKHKLSARFVMTAGPGKYEDGGGLRFIVSAAGARRWVLRVTVAGKRREMGLGSYPAVSLADARQLAAEARQLAAKGIDPIKERAKEPNRVPTFTSCAARYIRAQRRGWKNRKHARQWVSTLKTFARPIVGAKPVNEIGTDDILEILKPIWLTKAETAKRLQSRIENILDYAAANRWRDASNPARWQGHLSMMLPRRSKVQSVEHHPAMPFEEVPAYMEELAQRDGIAAIALQLLILSACRTSEVLNARWNEFDMSQKVWTIPAERMKSGKVHQVPLSSIAIALLEKLPKVDEWLFPGRQKGRPLSNMALLQVMRKSGFGVGGNRGDFVPHGFRSSFRDWAGEVSTYPRDICEMALAHTIQDKVESAYRRGSLLEKRRLMMGEWSQYLHPVIGKVIPIKRGAVKNT